MRYSMLLALVAGCSQLAQPPGAPEPPPAGPPGDPHGAHAGEPPALAGPGEPYAEPAPAPDPALAAPRPSRGASGDAQAIVDAHNRLRARHCAAPLTWSPRLAQVAQRWANTLRDKGCAFGHSGGTFGENLAAGSTGTLDAEAVVQMWYDEVAKYRFPNGGFSAETGHFTQVVWRGTSRIGCGRSQCKGLDIWVCEYDPAGNWEGKYRENVLPRGCR
jgi:hypothetical protein